MTNVIVIGAGPAGVMAALRAAELGASTVLVTRDEFGGMAANDGPILGLTPSRPATGGPGSWPGHIALHVDLLRLVVPEEPRHSFYQAIVTALLVGLLSGTITAIWGAAIYRAKAFLVHPVIRFTLGGLILGAAAVIFAKIAAPSAAVGPGNGAIGWLESTPASVLTIFTVDILRFTVDILRAVATTSSAAAVGCGGLFVPFLAIGDLAGGVFAPSLRLVSDLSGAAGAAGGISGGYHLPFTALAMVLGRSGHHLPMLTCFATVVVARFTGKVVASLVGHSYIEKRLHQLET